MRWVLAIVMVCALARPARALEVGLDGGSLVWNGDVLEERIDAVASTGVRWVRVNFRLDAWASVDDPGWLAAYDAIVDAFRARGIAVYGLINDEAVAPEAYGGELASDAFVWAYVAAAVRIVDHFKDRVRVWELFNEPNDWAGGTSARLPAEWMAVLLQETYLAVKRDHAGDPCWEGLTLVSGPLFAFDGTTAAEYLDEVYWYGRFTKAWDYTREVTGSFPLDAVGYHLYVHQGDATPLDVYARTLDWLAAIDAVVAAHEGAPRPIWVSELGWRADVVGELAQAERMEHALYAMNDHGGVAGGIYFQLQDFAGETWGVYDEAGGRRVIGDRLAAAAAWFDPEPSLPGDACAPADGLGAAADDAAAPAAAGCSAGGAAGGLPLLVTLALWLRRGRSRRR